MNSHPFPHEHFEELCALAALGQVSAEEHAELQAHLQTCGACRTRQADFLEILHEHLPVLDSQQPHLGKASNVVFHDASYKQRFLQRAAQQGIRFSDEVLGKSSSRSSRIRWQPFFWMWQPARLAYSVALLALGVWIGSFLWQDQAVPDAGNLASSRSAELEEEIKTLRERVTALSQPEPASNAELSKKPSLAAAATEASSLASAQLDKELTRLRQEHAAIVARSQSLDNQLQEASAELASLKAELDKARREAPSLVKLRDTEAALQQATDELQKLQRERAVYASTFADQQAQIRELMEKLGTQTETLQRERELAAAARDIRELMGARNLHIIDVADVDSRGAQRPFGRVFYTEGKSLIFYAYDLEKRKKSLEKYSFQAWGQTEAKSGSAQSLGVFVADDQAQNRWVLKYDDPKVLAKIDAVFVTIEPKGGSERPQGQQLMYAYLRANPNHP